MNKTLAATVALVAAIAAVPASAQDNAAARATRDWRKAHESQILAEYRDFLAIPNIYRDTANIRRNAEFLMKAMEKRGMKPRLLELPGASPAVYAEIFLPGAKHTYVFYSHYDGQPLDPKEWDTPPFEPTMRTDRTDRGGRVMDWPTSGAIDPNWRIYARSASDAKASIWGLLNAVDALNAAGIKPRANLRFIFEGEEEADSIHFREILAANKSLLGGDLWFICDGPQDPSQRLTVKFGNRGIQKMEVTVFGPKRPLHSGHYGNWAPNPALMLAQLLASMKDSEGRVLVEGYYDGVIPLGDYEQRILAESAADDAAQVNDLALGRSENPGKSLGQAINLPSLNIRGLAAERVGEAAGNVIPATATASLDLRLVAGITKEEQAMRVVEHIRKQGFFVVEADPDDDTRRAHPRIAKVVVGKDGYNAVRTPMELPLAQQVMETARTVRSPLSLQPTSGGSVPLDMIVDVLGTRTINIATVNHDNNQHARNENLRLQNLWDGMETFAALLAME
jgi:acetylornithine deacetylase/succinyl-diaminopimelate desuccinylase-like protein